MSDEKIVVELVLEDGKYTPRMKGAGAAARAFEGSVRSLDARMTRSHGAFTRGVHVLRDWSIIIGQARNVVHQLYFAFGQLPVAIIKSNAEIERMTFLLKGMSTAATEAGKSLEAKQNVATLFDMAREAPFSISAMTDSFVKFRSVGLDPLDGSMNSLVDAVAAFGGTDETLKRASIAIQQMGGKGVISMEELRQQLGEAVPQAITIMATSMGVSYGKLVDEISKGTVAAEPALEAMFNGFQLAFGGRAKAMMGTFSGGVAVMKTNLKELIANTPGMQNFFEAAKDVVNELGRLFGSQEGRDMADSLGNAFAMITTYVRDMISQVTVGYGKVASFFNLLTEQWHQEGTPLWIVRSLLGEIAVLAGKALDEVTALLFGEDQAAMFRRRLLEGRDLSPEELPKAQEVYEAETQKLVEAKKKRDRLMNQISGTAKIDNVMAQFDFDASVHDDVAKKGSERIEALKQQRTQVQQELRLALQDMSENGAREQELKTQELAAIQANIEKEEIQRNQNLEKMRTWLAAKTQIKERAAQIEQGAATNFDGFGDLLPSEMIAALNNAGGLAQDLKRQFEEAEQAVANIQSDVDAIAGTMNNEMGQQLEEALVEPMSRLQDLQAEFNTMNQEMQEEIRDMIEDTSISQEDRIAKTVEMANKMAETQSGLLLDLSAAVTAEIGAQSVAGQEAASKFAQHVLALIALIKSTADGAGEAATKGIVRTSPKPGKGGNARASAMKRLTTMIEDADEKAVELGKRLVDPFAYELPKAIDSAKKKIDKLAEKISGGKWTDQMKSLFNQLSTNAMTEEMIKMAEATRGIERSLMGEKAARKEIYDEEVSRIKQMKAKLIEMGIWRVEWEGTVQAQLNALQEQYQAQSPLGEFFNEWKDLYDNIEQVGVDAIKSLSQGIADMVTEGEADFASLARSAVNSLLQISIQAGLSGLGDIFKSAASGIFSAKTTASVDHSGGIAGSFGGRSRNVDPSMFMNAGRFHGGGMPGQEVPAILEKGEGVFTASQMKAIGAGAFSKSQDVKVNLINNSGQQLDSEQGNVRFDPNGMILDVVLKAAKKPGSFRDSLKGALSK